MARWFVMDRRVASELKKNYFFYLLSPARDGYATVFTYWEALTGVRLSRHFLSRSVGCFPIFYLLTEEIRLSSIRKHRQR